MSDECDKCGEHCLVCECEDDILVDDINGCLLTAGPGITLDVKIKPYPTQENINHPEHYQSKSGLEVIDIIESFDLNFNLGNVIKYTLRSGKKNERLEDLKKALWYLIREIENGEEEY